MLHSSSTRLITVIVFGGLVAIGPAAAQQWDVGALGGGAFHLDKTVSGAVSGKAGLKPGFVAGGHLGYNAVGKWGGEMRYEFQRTPFRASSGGQSVDFAGQTHVVHYDFVVHANTREDAVRPYVAFGGGIKGYRGTGVERAFQPLSNVAILSRVQQWQPMLSFGAGIKWRVGNRMMFRAEIRDFVTPFPGDAIVPSPGNKIGGLLHNITPLFGVSYLF